MLINNTYTICTLNDFYWDKALERVKNLPIYNNSHRKFKANEVGSIGEVVTEAWLNINCIPFKDERCTTHDYKIGKAFTLEVKTKDRTVLPKLHYDNSIPLYNHDHQRPDYYSFISLLRDKNSNENSIKRFTKACIVGAIDLVTLEEKGRRMEKNEIDPSNDTKFWTACLNISMSDLIPLNQIKKIWR